MPFRLLPAALLLISGFTMGAGGDLGGSTTLGPTPAPSPTVQPLSPAYRVNTCGVRSGVLLTVDDFPSSREIAAEHGDPQQSVVLQTARWAHATGIMTETFLIAEQAQAYQRAKGLDLVAAARAEGMYVSNHTYSHPALTALSNRAVDWQIDHGVTSTYLRPPDGATNDRIRERAASKHVYLCTWNVDTNDWRKLPNGRYPSAAVLRQRVLAELKVNHLEPGRPGHPGDAVVVLGHWFTNYPAAIPGIYADLKARGYRFCSVPSRPTTAQVPVPIC